MRTRVFLMSLLVLATPATAASTPGELVQELVRAAHSGDEKAFLAAMTAGTRHAMTDAEAAGSKLKGAEKNFLAALDERFGVGQLGGGVRFPITDRKAVLSRFVNIDLIGVEQKKPSEARLRLKTVTKISGDQVATEEDTFPAIKKSGQWKLDLTDLTQGIIQAAAQRTAAYEHVTQEIRSGAFKDRISALIGLAKALRGYPAGGGDK